MTPDHSSLIRIIGETPDPETGWPLIKALTDINRLTRELSEARAERDAARAVLGRVADAVFDGGLTATNTELFLEARRLADLPATDKAEP